MREIDRFLARLPFAPIVAALFAVVAVILVVATPQWLFERWVSLSGIAAAVPAAAPPLGEKARIGSAVLAGVATGGLLWLALSFGEKFLNRATLDHDDDGPLEATGVSSRRRPLSAGDELGAPLMSDEAMAQARDELILEIPLEDNDEAVTAYLAFADNSAPQCDFAETDAAIGTAAAPSEAIGSFSRHAVQPRTTEGDTIPALLDRLDAALAHKPAGYRPDRNDVTRLRRALGR